MVEHTVYPEVKNKAFHLPCEIKKMVRQKLPLPPLYNGGPWSERYHSLILFPQKRQLKHDFLESPRVTSYHVV